MKTINKIRGFSLIEMILVLGLSSLAFVGLLNYEKRKTENLKAESVGQQFEEVGKALSSYIAREGSTLASNIPVGTTATIPLTVLQGTTSGVYIGREYLPSTYSPTSGFGIDYVIQIRNNGPNSLTGMVVSNLPVTDETGQVRYDWIGHAIRKAGSQAGSAFFTGTSITGLNGGWNITNTTFPAITTAGQIAYRSQYQNNYDDIYLRRDGALPMTGNLNMGNFNIANATDISYNGWLYGNNALINNLKTGYILNTGNMRNEGNMQVVGSGSFDSIYVTNGADTGNLHNRNYMQNDGTLYNKGYMQNDGNMAVVGPNGLYVSQTVESGNLHNRNYMQNDGTLYNRGYMQNDGPMAVLGDMSVSGPNGLYVSQTVDSGNLHNRNYMQNDGGLSNYGDMVVMGPNGLYVAARTYTGDLQLLNTVTEGSACGNYGAVSRDASGLLLSCRYNVWRSGGQGGGMFTITYNTFGNTIRSYMVNPQTGGLGCPAGYNQVGGLTGQAYVNSPWDTTLHFWFCV